LASPDKRNAQTPSTWRCLAAIGESVLADETIRVVLLRGEGESFSAGLDRAMLTTGVEDEPGRPELAALDPSALDDVIACLQAAFTWWRDPRVVTIAAVQGHAVGAGFQLALACDLRVLAHDAQLAMRETSLGLVPDLAGTKSLVDVIGYSRALEICATGRWVAAEEAFALGLASLVVGRDELDAAATDLAAALLAAPAGALRATKELLQGAGGRTHAEQQAAERSAQAARLRDLAGGG